MEGTPSHPHRTEKSLPKKRMEFPMKRHHPTRGFGLMEVLVATTIATGAMLAVNNLLLSGLKDSRTIQSKTDFSTLQETVMLALSNPATCGASLYDSEKPPAVASFNPAGTVAANKLIASIHLVSPVSLTGPAIATAGTTYPSFVIKSVTLAEVTGDAPTVSGGQTSYLANLVITATPTGLSFLGAPMTFTALCK